MKRSDIPFLRALTRACAAALVLGGTTLAGAAGDNDEPRSGKQAAQPAAESRAASANLHFTDAEGNRRQPTAAEVRAAAEAFQRDLARLAGQHKDKPNVQTRADGTVSATVGASKLVFLTVEQGTDGELRYGHARLDAEGDLAPAPAHRLPEK